MYGILHDTSIQNIENFETLLHISRFCMEVSYFLDVRKLKNACLKECDTDRAAGTTCCECQQFFQYARR